MKAFFRLFIFKNKLLAASLLIVLCSRVIQALFIPEQARDAALNMYLYCNSQSIASFVLIPLFLLALSHVASFLSSPLYLINSKDRLNASLRCALWSGLLCLLFSLFNNLTSLFVVELGIPQSNFIGNLFFSTILQAIVFWITSLIFYFIVYLTGKTALAFIFGILYGLWDFIIINIVGGALPAIGWGLSIATPLAISDGSIVFQGAVLFFLLIISIVFLSISFDKKDYLSDLDAR